MDLYVRCGVDEAPLPVEDARRVLRRMATYPDYALYVAECDGHIVGTFELLIMDKFGPFRHAVGHRRGRRCGP
ncbi:MAG: hypothetical protein HW416_2705, partial [Chloroflexi bacterium]|nr:hypothetical protein [Chloroflexota bacterium]